MFTCQVQHEWYRKKLLIVEITQLNPNIIAERVGLEGTLRNIKFQFPIAMGRDVLWGRNQWAVKHPVMNFIYDLSSLFALHFLWYTMKLCLTSSEPGMQWTQSFTGNCPVQAKTLKSGIRPRMEKLLVFRKKSHLCYKWHHSSVHALGSVPSQSDRVSIQKSLSPDL